MGAKTDHGPLLERGAGVAQRSRLPSAGASRPRKFHGGDKSEAAARDDRPISRDRARSAAAVLPLHMSLGIVLGLLSATRDSGCLYRPQV